MEVLYGHAPLMAELGAGDVRIHTGAGIESASPGRHPLQRQLGIRRSAARPRHDLANDALKPEEIDVPRAEQQLDRGQKMWNEAGESEEAYTEALRVISEAEAKMASAAEKH